MKISSSLYMHVMHFTSVPSRNNNDNDDGSTMEKSRTKKLLHCALSLTFVYSFCVFSTCACLHSFLLYYFRVAAVYYLNIVDYYKL